MTPPLPQPVSGSALRADTGRERSTMSGTGPFVINLCSSTTPMALEQPKLGELKQRFTFFVSRRREDGRERFRLHMGYFETENEAEEWLAVVRDIYPGAWTGEAPGKRLREREAAAAAAAGTAPAAALPVPQPPPHVLAGIAKLQSSETATRLRTPPAAAALDARRSEAAAAAASSEFSVTFEATPPPSAPAFTVPKPDLAPIMLAPPLPASAPDAARSALVAASASAQAAVRMASPPPVLVVPTLQEAPPELPPLANIPVLSAPTISAPVLKSAPTTVAAASVTLAASTAGAASAVNAPASNAGQPAPPVALTAPKVTPPVFVAPPAAPVAQPVARAPSAAAPPANMVAKAPAPAAPVVKQAAKAAPQAVAKSAPSAPKAPAPRAAAPRPAPSAPPPAQPVQPAPTTSTNTLSNVAEVLKSLDETGQTRQMPVLPSQAALIQQTVVSNAPASSGPSMSDTQVLRYLENRRSDGSTAPPSSEGDDGISMLRPDDTGTVRALKEAVTTNQPVAFAVQLKWSVQPIELSEVPPLAIFSAYTLYTVEGSREGRKWFGLRLGFFTDAISAKQVAYYVRSEFASVAVVPVSPQERGRATDAGKNAAATRTASPPPPPKKAPADEFKLIDTMETPALPVPQRPRPAPSAPPPAARPAVAAAPAPKPQPAPKASPAPKRNGKAPGKVRARDRRTPQSLEETLEILGADQLEIDNGRGERLNDTGVRHLKVSVQKNSPFSRLLDRLSERVNKS